MEKHIAFTKWAVSAGIEIHGIAPHKFVDHGLGIVAGQTHETGDLLLLVPLSALRTADTVSRAVSKHFKDLTVHGLLALDWTLDTSLSRAPWRAVLPTMKTFVESMPFMWGAALQDLLPPAAKNILTKQIIKFKSDWTTVSTAFPELSEQVYLYNWLIVNTRTFYYVAPGTKKPPARDDCMALNPFADYFNHAEQGCAVEFGPNGFEICCDRVYRKGEEICISYGKHNNDFLLAEYGFILEQNRWDELLLDDEILPELSIGQKDLLSSAGFLGNYILDRERICYRTQVALMLQCVSMNKWQRFVDGNDQGITDQAKMDQILTKVLMRAKQQVVDNIDRVFSQTVGLKCQRHLLLRRWEQILAIIEAAIERIQR